VTTAEAGAAPTRALAALDAVSLHVEGRTIRRHLTPDRRLVRPVRAAR
jgi:hypothetical protein